MVALTSAVTLYSTCMLLVDLNLTDKDACLQKAMDNKMNKRDGSFNAGDPDAPLWAKQLLYDYAAKNGGLGFTGLVDLDRNGKKRSFLRKRASYGANFHDQDNHNDMNTFYQLPEDLEDYGYNWDSLNTIDGLEPNWRPIGFKTPEFDKRGLLWNPLGFHEAKRRAEDENEKDEEHDEMDKRYFGKGYFSNFH